MLILQNALMKSLILDVSVLCLLDLISLIQEMMMLSISVMMSLVSIAIIISIILEVKTKVVETKPIWPNTYLIFTKFDTTFARDYNARKLKHFTFCNLVYKFFCFQAKLGKHNALQLLFSIFFCSSAIFFQNIGKFGVKKFYSPSNSHYNSVFCC